MSDNASSSNNAAAGTPPNPAAPKPRNPVERAIVWGLIAVLVGVMLFEAKQKYAYTPSLNRITAAFKDDGEKSFKLSEVRQMLSGSPKETEIVSKGKFNRTIELQWLSLFKEYRLQLIVEKNVDDPVVMSFSTPAPAAAPASAEPVKERPAKSEAATDADKPAAAAPEKSS